MLPRQAAFRLLRRIALQDFKSAPRIAAFQKPISRPLHLLATPSLRNAIKPFEIPRKTTEAPADQPAYEMTFTCKPCSTRSTHRVSKQGYHKGSVLISCPGCKNRHVISDHLNIFGDKSMTIEDIIREQGQLVKKGTLSENGDFEIWADGTVTDRPKPTGEAEGAKIQEVAAPSEKL
ncbi:hypothetical protein VF21_05802 [Pseudogymnoascus sp. 05NY08]|nr:hypothetical protein VF21_05802 [Pseudogymnoascus sp. 05NY08]